MISKQQIKKIVGSATYTKGLAIYNADKIITMDIDDSHEEYHHISARVQGSGRNKYNVDMDIDLVNEGATGIECECLAFATYPGLCKHCAAVLLEYSDWEEYNQRTYMSSARESKTVAKKSAQSKPKSVQKTTPEIRELLRKKTEERALPLLIENQCGKVRLEPYLMFYADSCEVEFKLGMTQMYVMKDVFAFARSMKCHENYKYGKNLQFTHVIEAFDEESKDMVKFIMKWTNANEGAFRNLAYYGYYTSEAKSREMQLKDFFFEEFMQLLRGRTFLTNIDSAATNHTWQIAEEKLKSKIVIIGTAAGIELVKEKVLSYKINRTYIVFKNGLIYLQSEDELEPISGFLACIDKIRSDNVFISKEDIPAFCRELLPVLEKFYICEKNNFDAEEYGIETPEFKIYLDAPQENMIVCKPMVQYGEKKFSVYSTDQITIRDMEQEAKVRNLVHSYGNAFDNKTKSVVAMDDEEAIYELLVEGIPRMQAVAEVFISDAIKKMEVKEAPKISVGISIEGNLLELSMTAGDMSKEELIEILSRYNRKKKYYRLKNGSFINAEDSGFETLLELKNGLQLTDKQMKQDVVRIQRYRALYLDAQLKENPVVSAIKDKNFRALIRNMKTVEDNDYEVPCILENVLREYQKNGYLWIKTLKNNGFGGILADDMGLGKTLQVICFLLSEQIEKQNAEQKKISAKKGALIVAPASLVFNWNAEIEKFAAQLNAKMIVGSSDERKKIIENAKEDEILITSYDLLKRDISCYQKYEFDCEIIDEAQFIKNHNTQVAKAVKEIQADFKLALTGTPVENRLSELWSIFDYLMPGLLYSYAKFREELELPIVQNNDEDAIRRLQKMIRPFVLRRLKKDVLTDLPDKMEENMYAKFEGEQQKLYDAHVKRMKLLLDKQTDEEFKTNKIVILSELTKLRQICCDPALIFEDYKGESTKLEMCINMIQNAVSNGHKILLFSQFTSMLERLTERLSQENISHYILTGATSKEKRAKMVADFNQDDTSVFCISLKAGGTGLNLTSADIVIHYDPWWNLAVQNQATDRAHRIGQKNTVNVYKLIVKGSIEENIIKLQEKKRELADQILNGENMGSASFSKEELLELLA